MTCVAPNLAWGEARGGRIPTKGPFKNNFRLLAGAPPRPCGLRAFGPLAVLLTPYRPLAGMLVVRALPAGQIPASKIGSYL
jgi:hypothetical protein